MPAPIGVRPDPQREIQLSSHEEPFSVRIDVAQSGCFSTSGALHHVSITFGGEGGGTLSMFGDVLTGNEALGTTPAGPGQGGAIASTGDGTSLYVEQCV
jgi:hypothetical protein